ncbi:hypothetical protein AALA69_03955 [Eggerthellaceae bacterium 24-137]
MGDFPIGMALFVLIIIVGLVVGLRLSSTSPQRRAVAAAFASMTLVAALFWVVAIRASQVWTAPFFAIACIVVPIAAYMGVMKAAKAAQAARRREEPTLRARTTEPRTRTVKPGMGVDGALMPVTPNHPVNEFRSLHQPTLVADEAARDEEDFLVDEEDMLAEDTSEATVGEQEIAETVAEEHAEVDRGESSGNGNDGDAAVSGPDPKAEAFIEDYLVEQNEGDDGTFEPEVAPSLKPPQGSSHTTSTMMLTVPFAEGDERYLVVSDTETVPNPILAYKRTTSSHLVPLGAARRGAHAKPAPEPDMDTASVAPAIPEAVAVPEPQPEESFTLRKTVLDPNATGEVDFAAIFGTGEEPASSDDSQLALDFTAPAASARRTVKPASALKSEVAVPAAKPAQAPEPKAAAAVQPTQPESASRVASPEPLMQKASEPISSPAPIPTPEPQPVSTPAPEPKLVPTPIAASAEQEPAPAVRPIPAPVAEPIAPPVPVPEPAPVAEPIPARAPVPEPALASVAEPAPAPVTDSDPLAAPGIEVPADFVPASTAPASTREARFEEFLAKAQGLRDKGLYPVAARLYGEAAAAAPQGSDARRARFEEMACYVKAGQGDKARALAAELRTASVLTRVERIKLDAVERMG